MSFLDPWNIKQEILMFLRNQDVLTVTERGVTTRTDTGTFTNATTFTISRNNVRNIRTFTIASVAQVFGVDYTVDFTNNAGASQNCLITFLSTKNGAYSITYDYGTEAIYPDYPRDDRKLNSFPLIAVDVLGGDSTEAAIGGGAVVTGLSISITMYAASSRKVDQTITTIRNAVLNNKKNFHYISFITPTSIGPMLVSSNMSDKIVQRTIDFSAPLNYEE